MEIGFRQIFSSFSRFSVGFSRMAQLVPRWPSQSQDGLVSPRMAQLAPGWPSYGRPLGKMYFFHQGAQIGCHSRKTGFYVFGLFTPLYRRFRPSRVLQTIELEKIYRFVSKIIDFMPYGSVLSRFCVLYRFSIHLFKIYVKSI